MAVQRPHRTQQDRKAQGCWPRSAAGNPRHRTRESRCNTPLGKSHLVEAKLERRILGLHDHSICRTQNRPVFDNKTNPVIGSRDQRDLWTAQAQDAVYRRCLGSSAYLNGRSASAVQPRAIGGIDDDRAQPVAMRIPRHRKAGNRSAENHQGGQCDSDSAPLGVFVAIKLRELRLAVGASPTTRTVQSTLTCKTCIRFLWLPVLRRSQLLPATPARSQERVALPDKACRRSAKVIQVGATREIRTLRQAAKIARDGDIIEVDSGDYKGDTAVWTQNDLIIRGTGTAPQAGGRWSSG